MEGGAVMKKRWNMDNRETPTKSEKSPRNMSEASQEVLAKTGFNLEHEATRQDELVDFLRSNDLPLVDIRKLGESTLRLFCEIYKFTEARGDRMNVQIPSLSITYPDVLTSIKRVIEGLIEDVEEVKNKVINRQNVTTPDQFGLNVRNVLYGKEQNHVDAREVTGLLQKHVKEALCPEKEKNVQHGQVVPHQQEDVILSNDIDVGVHPHVRTKSMEEKLRLKRKTDNLPALSEDKPQVKRKKIRIMCQHCLDKPRNSIILRWPFLQFGKIVSHTKKTSSRGGSSSRVRKKRNDAAKKRSWQGRTRDLRVDRLLDLLIENGDP